MIPVLIKLLGDHLPGYFRVLGFSEFRAILAMLFAFTFVIVLGKRVIRWLLKQKIGDQPEFYNANLNELMKHKSNTPTMGGILIAAAILATTLLLADLRSFYVVMALVCLVWLAGVGAWDDRLKLTASRRRGAREGLYSGEKLLFQLGLAVLLGIFIHHHGVTKLAFDPDHISIMSHSLTLPLAKTWVKDALGQWVPSPDLIVLGTWSFVLLTIIVLTGASNAVNLTDGMDGLASGIMAIVSFAFTLLALIAGREELAKFLLVPYIPQSDELAIVAGAMCGSCLGFLWFNCNPAMVYMCDTVSLPLGGLIGFIAVVIRQEFLLLIIGGVFVLEAVSVMMQVSYFKWTKGKRIFKCAPIHHHFHLSGWTEQQVVVRFWIISVVLAAIALATLKLR
jgi:phospho-N-acetylmuramoyl-pentapeptide-transferase